MARASRPPARSPRSAPAWYLAARLTALGLARRLLVLQARPPPRRAAAQSQRGRGDERRERRRGRGTERSEVGGRSGRSARPWTRPWARRLRPSRGPSVRGYTGTQL
eukprot:2148509-Prymnesium_polylepis.1